MTPTTTEPATKPKTGPDRAGKGPTDTVAAAASDEGGRGGRLFWIVVGLHLLVVLLNAIPLFFYFRRSWELEHYQFFPIALLVFGFVLYSRIDRGVLRFTRWTPFVSTLFLLSAAGLFMLSAFEFNHYLPTVGVFLVTGNLLYCLQDRETGGSLFPVWLLLLPVIRIPLNFDVTLISELQFFSAAFAGNVLDFLGIPNYTPGTVIHIAQQGVDSGIKKFDVERACSGVQSLYTLLFCTLVVAVWGRRSFVAGLLLVASGIFWSITMNGIRIVICVAFFYWFDIDVYSGIRHEILGYLILFAAIGLVASTDALIGFFVSPIDVSAESRNYLARAWNRMIAGVVLFRRRQESPELVGWLQKTILSVLLSALLITNLAAGGLFVSSIGSGRLSGPVRIGELGLDENSIPAEIRGQKISVGENGVPEYQVWTLVEGSLNNIVRNTNSTYGPYSSEWMYRQRPGNELVQVSLDYTFLGWHELKICYKGIGWKVERVVLPDEEWKAVEMHLSRDNGETGYCIFSLFDYRGEPVEPLSDNLGFFLLRLKNRIAREFSTTTTFQIQCFIQSYDEIPRQRIEAVRDLHLKVREKTRSLVLERIGTGD